MYNHSCLETFVSAVTNLAKAMVNAVNTHLILGSLVKFSLPVVVSILNKSWCVEHFCCTACDYSLASRLVIE